MTTTFTFEPDFFEQQCIGRYLGLDTRPGEAATDVGFLIEREEKLAETPVCVIADRGLSPDNRSLRWDLLLATAPTGVMHAKVSLLVWEASVRVIVTSANLSAQAYRRSLEIAVAFDATKGAEIPVQHFDAFVAAIRRVVVLCPGGRRTDEPRSRALDILDRAAVRIQSLGLPSAAKRGAPRLAVVMPDHQRDAIDGLMSVWSGGPPTSATVMSPYFDGADGPSRAASRLVQVLAKRGASVDVVISVEELADSQLARVPRALLDAMPTRLEPRLFDVKQPDPSEPRKLHGKLVLLRNQTWVAALIGSSNFTTPGLGLGGGGNIEIGVALGAARGTPLAESLLALSLRGDQVALTAVEFEPLEDPDEGRVQAPAGFLQVLGDPGPPAALEIELAPAGLPTTWSIETQDGRPLLDAAGWVDRGRPSLARVETRDGELPFSVTVRWETADGESEWSVLPVNVTDPAKLPAPAELRKLPVEALLRALASVRPLHESIVEAIERGASSAVTDELDALKRFSPTGQLLHRTRELSAALAGLRERLERPAATLDAFRWRIDGAFGPLALADKLVEEHQDQHGFAGEQAFMVAEIALTLARVDLAQTSRFLGGQLEEFRVAINEATLALKACCESLPYGPTLSDYIQEAFVEALR